MKEFVIFLPLLLTLSACVSAPKGLEANEFTIQNIQKIDAEDYRCQCKAIRLGGKVLSATALAKQMKLEILSQPVDSFSAKPMLSAPTDGRFIAYINGFIDPERLKDQYITLSGVLKPVETGKIDQADYSYPVVQAKQYKLWKLTQDYYPDYWDDDFYWGTHWGGSYWGHRAWMWREPRVRYYLY